MPKKHTKKKKTIKKIFPLSPYGLVYINLASTDIHFKSTLFITSRLYCTIYNAKIMKKFRRFLAYIAEIVSIYKKKLIHMNQNRAIFLLSYPYCTVGVVVVVVDKFHSHK